MDEPRRSLSGVGLVIAGLTLPILYPLSAGPVGWIIIKCGSPAWTQPMFEAAYGPLIWLQDHGPEPIRQLLDSYLSWWW